MRNILGIWLMRFGVLCLAVTFAGAEEKRLISPQDVWAVGRVGAPKLSPDGRTVVYTVSRYSVEEDRGVTNLWLVDAAGGESRQLTFAKASDSSPQWSPDGRSIAFIRKMGSEPSSVHLLDLAGGEPRKVVELPLGIEGVRWISDGRSLVVLSRVLPEFSNDEKAMRAELKRRQASKVTGKTTENRTYRYWDQWLTDGYAHRLYRVDLVGGKRTELTPGSKQLFAFSTEPVRFEVSPDGRFVALAINVTEAPYREEMNLDVFLVPTDGSGKLRNLTEGNRGADASPRFSPDGSQLLYTHLDDPVWAGEVPKLMRLDIATGKTVQLAQGLDRTPEDFAFSPDGSAIYFTAEDRGVVPLFRMKADGSEVTQLVRDGTCGSMEVGAGCIVLLNDNNRRPAEVFSVDVAAKTPVLRPLTHVNDALMSGLLLGRAESMVFKGADNADVQMWVYFPPGFDAADKTRKWPLVQILHGGPHTMVRDSFSYRWNTQVFAAAGHVIACINRHGSTGFGEKFGRSIVDEWGLKPTQDILRGSDYLLQKYPQIDGARMAAAGGSYGGYLATWLLGHTDRFKCYIVHAGVTELVSQFSGDVTYSWTQVFNGTPWEGRDGLLANSPLHHAANFNTPTLVVHGELDYRVPVGQGLALYGILQAKGVPSRLLYYPNENHWVLKPQNSIQWNVEFRNWLVRHIGGTPLEMPVIEVKAE